MSSKEPVLTDSKTLNEVVNCLTEHIPIRTQGKCEQQNIFEILIRGATQRDSIENTTKVLKNVPTSNDIRYHLEKYTDRITYQPQCRVTSHCSRLMVQAPIFKHGSTKKMLERDT